MMRPLIFLGGVLPGCRGTGRGFTNEAAKGLAQVTRRQVRPTILTLRFNSCDVPDRNTFPPIFIMAKPQALTGLLVGFHAS